MNATVLVGVHDSAASAAAAAAAIEHARSSGAALRAVAVVEHDGIPNGSDREAALLHGREQACSAALADVARRATAAGVEAEVSLRRGRVAAEILAEAAACHASVIVMGRMDRPGHVIPAIGSHTLGVVEFAHVPVLVVPELHAAAHARWRG
ncbi:universal stress protein [Demequina sp.]|uniref:universal stress protein n=1 Tax=Demequina sp. TaxID=2050685 RepID=UPI0025DECFEF|nr:universal stress protein [Demequina sp.]